MNEDTIKECPVCHNQVSREPAPYEVFNVISDFLEGLGWGITVLAYKELSEAPCLYGEEHNWDARKIAGIPFRRCLKCGCVQRRLYRPYFEDYEIKMSEVWWREGDPCSIENLTPGSLNSWQ